WPKSVGDNQDLAEVGSNRTMNDVLRRSEAHALLRRSPFLDAEDYRRGAREALVGRVRGRSTEGYHEARDAVEAYLAKQLPKSLADAAVNYWCQYFVGALQEDKSEGERTARELREVAKDPAKLAGLARAKRFADWVDAYEGKASEEVRAARLAMALKLFDETNTFEAAKKGRPSRTSRTSRV